ncbi:MAG: hypothetical protein K1Y36_06815 [Blastocatellia bacterium]|nr:hypothetical protein [Blastocatellia bacterium]
MGEEWKVDIDGKIFDVDLETLKQWVADYQVLSHHKVKKGNLNWLKASAVPALETIFKAIPPPPQMVAEVMEVKRNVTEHLVVPFASIQPTNASAVVTAAKQLQDLINHHSLQGWEFYRMDSVSLYENPGCLAGLLGAKTTETRLDMVIFRRVSVLTETVPTGRLIPG